MGLTIHYKLATNLTAVKDVRRVVEAIRQFALDLPFKDVGELNEYQGGDFGPNDSADDSERWLKTQAAGLVVHKGQYNFVAPKHAIVFSTWPGEGCEAANFGLCRYPGFIQPKEGPRIPTNLKGWSWSSFCKTQYASDPRCGGIEHFLRCHLMVVKLLDFLKQTGLVSVEVDDEGEYWGKRNVEALAKEVGGWNQMIAGIVSGLREAADENSKNIEAAITGFPNFEHLEAKGLERLADLRQRLDQPE